MWGQPKCVTFVMPPAPPPCNGGHKHRSMKQKFRKQDPSNISIWIYDGDMARAATTEDAFNAVAEPRRRQILDSLTGGERTVNELVDLLDLAQPHVSRHLRVLREVGAVSVRDMGRKRVYSLDPQALKPIYD